jgi:hypothetical protein
MGATHLKSKKVPIDNPLDYDPSFGMSVPPQKPREWSDSWEEASYTVEGLSQWGIKASAEDARYKPTANHKLLLKTPRPGWRWESKYGRASAKTLETVWNAEARGQAFIDEGTARKILQALDPARPLSEQKVRIPFSPVFI